MLEFLICQGCHITFTNMQSWNIFNCPGPESNSGPKALKGHVMAVFSTSAIVSVYPFFRHDH